MPRTVARWSLWVAAIAFGVLGAVAFVAPGWASESFPWRVGPFLAMTIGGWSLGTAGFAADAARDLRPERAYPLIVYLGLFGAGQLLVVAAFADRLAVSAILTWPYLIGLVALVMGSVAAAVGWRREPRSRVLGEGRVPAWARIAALLLVVFVGGLALATFLAGPDGAAAQGRIFPEPMSLFSIRAFSAFFFALAISMASLLPARQRLPYHELARAGLYLIVPITVAALLNVGLFDFTERPGTLLYLAAYVVVGIGLALVLWRDHGQRPPPQERHAG